ncbi:hypothetical protein Sjap_018956 [Stephania japonica]|uniref:Uncharacterized protein n=1 Tax=Stephania japonica TaxID=461633 RepID=A0AAP0F3C5_9MAGN
MYAPDEAVERLGHSSPSFYYYRDILVPGQLVWLTGQRARAPPFWSCKGELKLPSIGPFHPQPLALTTPQGLRRLASGPSPPLSGRRRGRGRMANHPFPPLSMVHMGWGRRSLLVGLPPPLRRRWGSLVGAPLPTTAVATVRPPPLL